MKIAVLYSGQYRANSKPEKLMNANKSTLTETGCVFDYYFSTWSYEKSHIKNTIYFDEPKVDYNTATEVKCVEDINNTKWQDVLEHAKKDKNLTLYLEGTKQILAHCMLLDKVNKNHYDLIIRMRWDVCIKNIKSYDLLDWIEKSKSNHCAVGIGKYWPKRDINNRHQNMFLTDLMIIHPPSLLDSNYVYSLNETKKLRFAEFGWYQALSKDDNHVSILSKAINIIR